MILRFYADLRLGNAPREREFRRLTVRIKQAHEYEALPQCRAESQHSPGRLPDRGTRAFLKNKRAYSDKEMG